MSHGRSLYPSVPLWSFVSGAACALWRALSLAAVPQVVFRDLPSPVLPSPRPTRARPTEEGVTRGSPSAVPSLGDLLAEEEHEVSVRRRRAQRKRAQDSAARTRRHSLRLAAKEEPYYVDATSKAARVKAAQLDLARASARMREALVRSGMLERPPPRRIPSDKLSCLGRACGLPALSVSDEEVDTAA